MKNICILSAAAQTPGNLHLSPNQPKALRGHNLACTRLFCRQGSLAAYAGFISALIAWVNS
jgi:hypothetical protein